MTTSDREYQLYDENKYVDSVRQCEMNGMQLLDLRSAKEERMIDDFLKREFYCFLLRTHLPDILLEFYLLQPAFQRVTSGLRPPIS